MACNRPFSVKNKQGDICLVPCGWCRQCRIDRRNEWTHRIMSEISGSDGAFLTLTYDDLNCPPDGSLVPSHVQTWLKRFRASIGRSRLSGAKIKYYLVGEYGELGGLQDLYGTGFGRPHYHLIVMGLSPYEVDEFARLTWKLGFIKTLPANVSTVRYVLKYMDKQIHGQQAIDMYGDLVPPFARMSRGIGLRWLIENQDFISENGGFYSNGRLVPPPRYYRNKLGVVNSKNYDTPKYKKLLDYMDKHDCTLEVAMNRLGSVNEQELNSRDNLFHK